MNTPEMERKIELEWIRSGKHLENLPAKLPKVTPKTKGEAAQLRH